MKKGFSLIELMVVILILGTLAMFVLPNLTGKSEEAQNKITCIQMKSVAQTLKMYKLDYGKYPSTTEGLKVLIEKHYFDENKFPKDSWSNKFIYTSLNDQFELISKGADSKESSTDDIYYSKCLEDTP